MSFRELYEEYLTNPETRYFVLDSGVISDDIYDEVEFSYYTWSRSRFNLVRPNDLFIYRRPTRVSENRKFYFFGSGRFRSIEDLDRGDSFVHGHIIDAIMFNQHLYQDDDIIESFEWTFKERGDNWHNFFNQYGMTQISREDFIRILNINESLDDQIGELSFSSEEEIEILANTRRQFKDGNYRVSDQEATVKVRGAAQRTFSNAVRDNYRNKCCITEIKTREVLIASHIIPWAEDENNRINPSNGLLLSSLIDKAFDKGYISFDNEYKLIISPSVQRDQKLLEYLMEYEGDKIKTHGGELPDDEFLEWHRSNIFKSE